MAAAADAALARLKLPANESLQEGQALAADEQIYLADTITPRLRRRQATLAAIDVTSCVRIFRGMITNNKGPLDQRLREAIEAYDRAAMHSLQVVGAAFFAAELALRLALRPASVSLLDALSAPGLVVIAALDDIMCSMSRSNDGAHEDCGTSTASCKQPAQQPGGFDSDFDDDIPF